MLRLFVAGIGVLCLAGAVWIGLATHVAWAGSVQLSVFGILILGSLLFERHYRGRAQSRANLQQTGERFVDPVSGSLTEVLYDPKTGERVYRKV